MVSSYAYHVGTYDMPTDDENMLIMTAMPCFDNVIQMMMVMMMVMNSAMMIIVF